MLADILITILLIASTFYMTIVLLRFLLQLARADFYNPISQFVVKATNPPLRPLRRFIPGWGGVDGASLVLAVIIQGITFFLILVALNGVQLVAQITEPVMRPVRNIMPSMGGLDLSPIIVFLILNVISVVIEHMKMAAGLGSIGLGM